MAPQIGTRRIEVAFSARTDVGRVREHNEDACVTFELDQRATFSADGVVHRVNLGPKGVLLAVSDGMGGAAAGEVASALVLQVLEESLAEADEPTDDVLRDAVENANRAVFQAARDPNMRGMGATLTAVLVRGRFAYIASVGDSRAYLQRGARFRRMTKDHSYVQVMIDAGVLDSTEAERSPLKHVVLQSMGQNADVQVAMGRLALFRGDRFIICSDGLTGHVNDDELSVHLARREEPFDIVTRRLIDLALERGGEDNVTVIVAEVSGEGLERAEIPESVTQTFQVLSEFQPGFGERSRSADRRSTPEPPEATPPLPVEPRAAVVSGAAVTRGLVALVVGVALLLAIARLTMG